MAEISIKNNGFSLGKSIKLKTGAVITPILVGKKKQIVEKDKMAETNQLLEYLKKNSWGLCRERNFCIEIAIKNNLKHFSCERCPKKGRREFLIFREDLESSIEGCWALLREIFDKD